MGNLGVKIQDFFTTEEEDSDEEEEGFLLAKNGGAIVLRMASAITCMSGCRPEDETPPYEGKDDEEEVAEENQTDDIIDASPNAKLRLLNLLVGIFQFLTSSILFGLVDPDRTWPWYVYY